MIRVTVKLKHPIAGKAPVLPPVQPARGGGFDPSKTLCLAVAYTNPQHWKSRRQLFQNFLQHISSLPNLRVFVGELAYGNDPFEVTQAGNPNHLQLRAKQILWHKENILSLVIQKRFPRNWLYGAYSDADFQFSRMDLAARTIHVLQTHEWVQLFSNYSSLTYDHRLISNDNGFAWCRAHGKKIEGNPCYGDVDQGATGGAWAFRRDAYDAAGGLMDFVIVGSADWHMTFGIYGLGNPHPELKAHIPNYIAAVKGWQQKALSGIRTGPLFVDSNATHYWHGRLSDRGYGTRWQCLRDFQFDPNKDLVRNQDGVYQVVPQKQGMADAILKYFQARNEDAVA